MSEFSKQVEETLKNYIIEFNSKPEYTQLRALYKDNFNIIKGYIQKAGKFGHKLAIEDISNLDRNLAESIFDNRLFLQEINRAISIGKLTLHDLK